MYRGREGRREGSSGGDKEREAEKKACRGSEEGGRNGPSQNSEKLVKLVTISKCWKSTLKFDFVLIVQENKPRYVYYE